MRGLTSGLLRRLAGRSGDRQRGFAEAGVAVTGAALVLGAALGSGVASTVVTMSDGVTWLPDDQTGQIVQVNPGTGRAERRLQIGGPGSELAISQRDGHLVVTDASTGTISSIDLATLLASGSRRAEDSARVLVGGGQVYVVTATTGVVRAVDPLTLQDVGTPHRARAALADVVVDGRGAVWFVTTAGDLRPVTWLPDEQRFDEGKVQRVRGAGAGTRLLPHDRGVTVFAPDGGAVLQVGVGRQVAVAVPELSGEVLPAVTAPSDLAPAGVPGRSAVVMLAGDRVLDVAVGELGCARPDRPAVFAGLVYVPCTGAGRVVVLRPDGTRARADVILPGGKDPRLLVDDGRLVVHTEDGARAVVVEADGRTRVVDTGRARVAVHDARNGGGSSVAARPPQVPPAGGAAGSGAPASNGVPVAGGPAGTGPDGAGPGQDTSDGVGPGEGGTSGGSEPEADDPSPAAPAGTGRTSGATAARTPRATPSASAPTLPAPSGVVAVTGAPDADGLTDVAVTWRAAATRPQAYVVRSSVVGVAPVEVDGRTTRTTVRGLVCGVRATFTVEAVDGSARSAAASSAPVTTQPCPEPPAAPTGVTAVAGTDGTVTVTWAPPGESVDHYLVGPAGGSATTAPATASSLVLRDVPPARDVQFAVRAVRDGATSTAALSAAVVVPGAPGALAPVTMELTDRKDTEVTVQVRWELPDDNGSTLSHYTVTWSGLGQTGSSTPAAFGGCSASRGCLGGGGWRVAVPVTVTCTAAVCQGGGPLTVTVTAHNAVGAGPTASGTFDVPPAPARTTVIAAVEPVVPAPDDPDVRMVVRLDPPQVFLDHRGPCLLEINHSNGTTTSSGWGCRQDDIVIGPFPPGVITVTARTYSPGGASSASSMPFRADVPPRSTWESCDTTTGGCTGAASLTDPGVDVVPVPWTPRLPAGPGRPPLAATGLGLLLAAGTLRAARRRGAPTTSPTPSVTTEETPA